VVQISANADKADDPKEDKADNDMDAQGFLNMFTDVNTMNNSDDDLGWGLDQENDNNSAAAKRPYPELIPTFVSITGLVQTAGDLAFVRWEINQIYSVLTRDIINMVVVFGNLEFFSTNCSNNL
jgi:hypothetical protein